MYCCVSRFFVLAGGKHWSNLTVLIDAAKVFGPGACPAVNKTNESGSCEFWDPTPFADRTTGEVFVMTTRSWAHDGVDNVASRMTGRMDCWLLSSRDLGVTWSKPRNITSQVWSPRWHMMTPANGHAMQTSTGRLLMPGYVRPFGSDATTMSAVFYSDDHGAQWHFAPNSTVGPSTPSPPLQLERAHAVLPTSPNA